MCSPRCGAAWCGLCSAPALTTSVAMEPVDDSMFIAVLKPLILLPLPVHDSCPCPE